MDARSLLLGDTDPEAFFASTWGRGWVRSQGPADRFAGVFAASDLAGHVLGDLGDGPRPALGYRAAFHGSDGTGRTFSPPLELAGTLFKAGMTLVWSDVQLNHPRVAQLAAAVGAFVKARAPVAVQCIVSPPGTGFPWHYDFTHVFALQISGSKRWHIGRTRVDSPPFHQQADALRPEIHELMAQLGMPYALPGDGDADEVELVAGDALYLPPGTWHRAQATARSCHLSVLVRPVSFARLLRATLTAMAMRQPGWRRELSRLDAPPGSRAQLLQTLADRLAEARRQLAAITPEQLAQTMDTLAGSPALRDVLLERARDLL